MDQHRFSVSSDELKLECLRRRYCELLSRPEVFPSAENWEFIIANRLQGLGHGLLRKFLVARLLDEEKRCDYHQLAIDNFPRYLKAVDRQYALSVIYSDTETDCEAFVTLVTECELFDAALIGEIIDNGQPALAAKLLAAFQPEYDGDDVDAMQYLLSKFARLPRVGAVEVRKTIFKTENRYICPNGHSNPADTTYCSHEDCGLDIYGLCKDDREAVDKFAERIDVLRDMLG